MKKRKIIHPLDREYEYKENDTFYLIDTEVDINIGIPILKCTVKNVKPKWYPYLTIKPDYCFVSKTCMGYCTEENMYRTLHEAKIAYLNKLNEDMLKIAKEYNERCGKVIEKMIYISDYKPPE